MKTEQEQIEEMAKQMCGAINNSCIHDCTPACGAREYAKRCFEAGYRKANDVVYEFVERLEKYIESRNDLWDEDRPEFDEEFVKFGIQIVADEMRQEVER